MSERTRTWAWITAAIVVLCGTNAATAYWAYTPRAAAFMQGWGAGGLAAESNAAVMAVLLLKKIDDGECEVVRETLEGSVDHALVTYAGFMREGVAPLDWFESYKIPQHNVIKLANYRRENPRVVEHRYKGEIQSVLDSVVQ